MNVYYYTSDLLFASQAIGLAESMGIAVRVVSSWEMLFQESSSTVCRLVILDLSSVPTLLVDQVQRLREVHPAVKVVAYAPHVHAPLLEAATTAGCDEVLARGQFHQLLPRILQAVVQ